MPPPPPSKSYNLLLDTDSEDEEDEYYHHRRSNGKNAASISSIHPSEKTRTESSKQENSQQVSGTKVDELKEPPMIIDETSTCVENETAQDATSEKKKKKKKKRRKKKAKTKRNLVTFSPELTICEYPRMMGGQGVPLDGGWPLSLENKPSRSHVVDLEEYERLKQVELRERYQKYVKERRIKFLQSSSSNKKRGRQRSKSHGNAKEMQTNAQDSTTKEELEKERIENVPIHLPPESYIFETRQLDYKRKRTPHSHALFNITHAVDSPEKEAQDEWDEIQELGVNVVFGPMNESKRREILLRASSNSSSLSPPSSPARKTRSEKNTKEIYSETEIRHVRSELEQLRIHRTEENCAGCSCRKLQVALPRSNQSKKNHSRRLTERRVKDELRKRHIHYDNSSSRNELEIMLHDIVEKEGCCFGMDCPCVRNGINCQADTCSCWKSSHATASHKDDYKDNEASVEEIQNACGNKNGIYVYDLQKIAHNRRRYIHAVENQMCGVTA